MSEYSSGANGLYLYRNCVWYSGLYAVIGAVKT